MFFSVRCGLLVEEYSAEKLPEDKQNFVDTVVDSILKNDTSTEKYLYEYGCECYAYEEVTVQLPPLHSINFNDCHQAVIFFVHMFSALNF